MSVWAKVALGLGAAVLVAAVGGGLYVWKRPLEVYAWQSRKALAKAGLTRSAVQSPVGTQVYWEGGSGRPTVLLHGAGDQAGTWSKVAPALLSQYKLIIPDLAGHGESAPEDGPLPVGVVLSGLEAVLDKASPGEPVTLTGNSLGGWVATLYAQTHSARVAQVLLVNGGALRGEHSAVTLQPANREEARTLMQALRDPSSPPIPDFVLDDVIRLAREGPIARLAAAAQDMERYVLDGRLSEIKTPVAIIWGASDRLMPIEYAERMRAELPNVRLRMVPKCGHVPQQECPEALLEALQAALEAAGSPGAAR
ncbi:MAG: alpha/beta fold hydrolase [Acidobacteriota bacterium]